MLKQKLFLLTVLVFIAMPLLARESGSQITPNLYLGASTADCTMWTGSTLGVVMDNDPTLWGDPSIESDTSGGVGISYKYFMNDTIAFNTGLNILYKSCLVKYPALTAIDDLTISYGTSYIIVPVGLRAYFEYFFIGAGVYYGYAGDADAEITFTSVYGTESVKETIDFNNDFGLYFDIGLDIPLSQIISLEIGMRYEHGLSTVYEEENDIITDIKTRALLFNVGMGIMI